MEWKALIRPASRETHGSPPALSSIAQVGRGVKEKRRQSDSELSWENRPECTVQRLLTLAFVSNYWSVTDEIEITPL